MTSVRVKERETVFSVKNLFKRLYLYDSVYTLVGKVNN